jgi:DNA helicase HerA-like ATPase
MEEVGKVLEASTPLKFLFKANINSAISLHNYVIVEVNEFINGEIKPLKVLAEVIELKAKNPLATESMTLEQRSDIYSYKVLGAEVLGYLDEAGLILRPKSAPNPGTSVYKADSKLLCSYFKGIEEKVPICIGKLIKAPDVIVPIHLQEAQFHIGIFAATRAGKSYLAGKIIEEILEHTCLPVIVVDIHGDYVKMDQMCNGNKHNLFNVVVYQPPNAPKIEGLTAERRELKIGFRQVSIDALLLMLGKIGDIQTNIIEEIVEELSAEKKPYGIKDIISIISERLNEKDKEGKPRLKGSERGSYIGLLRRLRGLERYIPFTEEEMDIGSFFKPKTLSVICLTGLRMNIQDAITASMIDLIFKHQVLTKESDPDNFLPVFLFIEEAHRVASSSSRFAVETISTAIREGAKYGLFLVIISQRPRSIDQDILSNIGNYAVLRITNQNDQAMIESASESFSHRLVEDLPALNQGEAVLVGPFVSLPAHIKVLERKTTHRGITPRLYEIIQRMNEKMKKWEESWE